MNLDSMNARIADRSCPVCGWGARLSYVLRVEDGRTAIGYGLPMRCLECGWADRRDFPLRRHVAYGMKLEES